MPGDVHTSNTLEPGPVVGADPRSKVAGLRVDAQRTDGILASLEVFFLVKPASPWGHTRSAEALFSFVSQQPRSPFPPATNQPSTRDGQGASWATSSTDHTPARVRGLVLKRIAMVTFCFLLRQAADRQVLSKAKPPTVKTSKRYAIKITPQRRRALVALLLLPALLSTPALFPLRLLVCSTKSPRGGLDNIAPRSVVSRIWAAVLACGPQGCTHTHTHNLCKLSQRA